MIDPETRHLSWNSVKKKSLQTTQGTYMKWRCVASVMRIRSKDVARVFQMENLRDDVQKKHTEYIEGEDYEFLFVENRTMYDSEQTEKENRKRLFFTYQGLIKVITNSRSGTAHHFMNWMKRIVFIILGSNIYSVLLPRGVREFGEKPIRNLHRVCSRPHTLQSGSRPGARHHPHLLLLPLQPHQ